MFNNISLFTPLLKINHFNLNFLIVSLLILLVILIIGQYNNNWTKESNLNFFKNSVLSVFFMSFCLFLYYFFILMHYKNMLFIQNFIYNNYAMNHLNVYVLDTSSIIIIYLCYLIGFISFITLGDRFWNTNYKLSLLFIFFLIIINFLCNSNNLFELFIYYELLLLPSVLFVYKSGYTKKSKQSNIYFLLWTQLGSIIVMLGIIYIENICGNADFLFVKNYKFNKTESYYLYLLFFFGFGVKVPLWPFHFWLIKVHVESPSGFSIFLSGFLVKSAIYCFYKITLLINIQFFYLLPTILCLTGMLDASLKMWTQTDIKKLIAYATVQEMNAIYLLFNLGDSWCLNAGLVFLLAHGLLSALMFYLVECLYKRYNSRNLQKIYGVSQMYPNLAIAIWAMLILFLGFPGTLKFYAEFQLALTLVNKDMVVAFLFLFIFVFIGSVGFVRCWFSLLYGHPGYKKTESKINLDLTVEEFLIISLLTFLSIIPSFFLYLL